MPEVTINAVFDIDSITKTISEAKDLKDNHDVFKKLSEVAVAKSKLEKALDEIKSVEDEAKQEINAKAKALYGENWKAIAGNGYSISRRRTGSVYDIADPDKAKDYVKVEVKADSAKINEFIKTKSGLPDGIEYNPNRGEAITIKVNADS